ncbi:MAG: hypothetical protein KBT57_06260, partial [bacterium]|nr:hypothetical protein [Candidatus Limimorpha equi]
AKVRRNDVWVKIWPKNTNNQIAGIEHSYVLADDIERPIDNKLPVLSGCFYKPFICCLKQQILQKMLSKDSIFCFKI